MLELLVLIGLAVVAFCVAPLVISGLIQMWGNRGSNSTFRSGIGGALSELDRIARPSIEHVIEVKDSVIKHEDDIGGD